MRNYFGHPYTHSIRKQKIETLDDSRQSISKQIADLQSNVVPPDRILQISNHLEDWDSVAFDDRHKVVNGLISIIRATSENVHIEWKI